MRTHKKTETLQRDILPQEETIRGLRFKAQSPAAENERLRAGTAVMNLPPDAPRYTYTDISDEVGHLYPTFTILCSASGDLSLQNSLSGIRSCIRGCSPEEVLTMTCSPIAKVGL